MPESPALYVRNAAYPQDMHDRTDFQPTHVWYWRAKLPDRHGQPCRVVARGAKNSILVEFADGHRVVTSRHAVRRIG